LSVILTNTVELGRTVDYRYWCV